MHIVPGLQCFMKCKAITSEGNAVADEDFSLLASQELHCLCDWYTQLHQAVYSHAAHISSQQSTAAPAILLRLTASVSN